MIKKRNFTEYEKGEARKNTFIFLGLTGKGKSQIIKYLTGDPDAVVSSSLSSCTPNSNLYYGSLNTDMNHEELFCLVDTAGLCDSQGEEQDKKNYEDIKNILLNNKCKIKGIFIIENFQDERMNGEERKIIAGAADLFPLKKFWDHTTFIYTHYYNKGSTSKVQIKKQQQAKLSESLMEIMSEICKRVKTIDFVDERNVHKLYVNIDNNVIEQKGFNMNDEEEAELYQQGLKDLEKAKKDLYKELLEKIKSDPLYDDIKDLGQEKIKIRKDNGFYYDMYEALIETRVFYLKGDPILTDIIACSEAIFKQSINKAFYHLGNIAKGTFLAELGLGMAIIFPIMKILGTDNNKLDLFPALAKLNKVLFPKEMSEKDMTFRKKLY